METAAATHRCLEPFRWKSLRGWDFRPQLIVVSGLFGWESLRGSDFRQQLIVVSGLLGGNPFVDGILGHNLLLSRAFSSQSPLFLRWNSDYREAFFTNLFIFHNGILAIRKPFFTNFSFFTMELWLSRSLSHELCHFFTIEFWLSGSLFSRTFLFSRWNSSYQEAFLTSFFIFFTMEFWLSGSLSHELFPFFTMEFSKYAIWGKTLFIYITKSIYTGSASLKTLPLDLEPPLQGKEYGPPYSNASKKGKANVFSRNHL
jgi:hypothetical protein